MYQVSQAFKNKIKEPIQEHRLTGTIGNQSFSEDNIVEGSFSINNQSTDTSDVVLGSCYVGQLTAEFTGINIAYGSWINKTVTPTFALNLGDNTWESVPLGIYKIKEAKHTDHGVQVTAYDNMIKFDKKFKKSHYMNLAGMWNIISQICTDAGVTLGMTQAQIEVLPNGDRTGINIYGSTGKKSEFANDITTLRDLLFWVAQTLGCFATINRTGQLEFRQYTQNVVDVIASTDRIEGATFADYITHYVGIYVENLDDNTEDYYGHDVTALQQELSETQAEITEDNGQITDLRADLVEWKRKLDNQECTQQEYDAAVAEINAQIKQLTKEVKQLTKRAEWLTNAIAQSSDDGADMVLGANPLTMAKNLTTRDQQRREIMTALDNISYTPFNASVICGAHYDLGDVIQWSGGLYNSETDSFGCVMSWTYTHNCGTELEGFGVDPAVVVVRNKTQKSTDRASKNSVDAARIQVNTYDPNTGGGGTVDPVPGKNGDFFLKTTTPQLISKAISMHQQGSSWTCPTLTRNKDGTYFIVFSGTNTSDDDTSVLDRGSAVVLKVSDVGQQSEGAVSFFIQGDFSYTGIVDGPWMKDLGIGIANYPRYYAWANFATVIPAGFYSDAEGDDGCGHIQIGTSGVNHFEGTLKITPSADGCLYIMLYRALSYTYAEATKYGFGTITIRNFSISRVDSPEYSDPQVEKMFFNDGTKWNNIDYVNDVSQTQGSTGGTEIAEINNTNGTKTKIYQKTVTANPTGTPSEVLSKLTIGETLYKLGGGQVDDVKVDNVSVVSNKVANINTMTGATAQEDGTKGLVPAPAAGDNEKFLRGDGTWQETGGGTQAIELTKAQYDALPSAEKNDPNKVYYVTDYPGGGGGTSPLFIDSSGYISIDYDLVRRES